jgi:hypothetical protein
MASGARVGAKGLALTKPRPRVILPTLRNAELAALTVPWVKGLHIDVQQRGRPDMLFPARNSTQHVNRMRAMITMGWCSVHTGNRQSKLLYIGGATLSDKGVLRCGVGIVRGSPGPLVCFTRYMSSSAPKPSGSDTKGPPFNALCHDELHCRTCCPMPWHLSPNMCMGSTHCTIRAHL